MTLDTIIDHANLMRFSYEKYLEVCRLYSENPLKYTTMAELLNDWAGLSSGEVKRPAPGTDETATTRNQPQRRSP
jgi:hypothetical protein